MKKLIFLLGIFFLGSLIHELIHYIDCGGEFVAGVYWNSFNKDLIVATTWCARADKWGEWPIVAEILIWTYGLWNVRKI